MRHTAKEEEKNKQWWLGGRRCRNCAFISFKITPFCLVLNLPFFTGVVLLLSAKLRGELRGEGEKKIN